MPFDVNVSISGDKAVLEGLGRLQTNLTKRMVDEVEQAAKQTKEMMYAEAPTATGDLKESIELDIKRTATTITAIIEPKAEYAKYVESGRSPGRAAPPIDAIQTWLLSKGLDEKTAFVLARRIGQRGIEPNPFVERTVERLFGVIKARIVTAVYMAVRESM